MPTRARAELIARIAMADSAELLSLSEQAHRLGLPVQHTHVAAWIKVPNGGAQHAETALAEVPGLWHVVSFAGELLVTCTEAVASGLGLRVRSTVQSIVDSLTERGDQRIIAGLGTAQAGAVGIRMSAAEAREALDAACARGEYGRVADTDATGLRRVLADLHGSPGTRSLLSDLLKPLDELGGDRARIAVETLAAFLAAQGSPTKTSRALHLHPNAVSYRLQWIAETLDVDLKDPDSRFAVELACRVRLLNR